jgi:transcriptional regulator with XRE-family HTH domain
MRPRRDHLAIAWLIGNELRQARVRVGETQVTAAARLGTSTSRMTYLETGRNIPRPEDVHALMAFYGHPAADAERLAALLERPTRRVWWAPWKPVIADHDRLFFGLEGFATGEFVYVPSIVPGMLQTPAYAAGLIPADQVSPLHHDRIVEFRQVRQERLLDPDNPLTLQVVIDEHALGRPVGDATVLRDQLDHLLAVGERSNVSIRVMPDYVAVHDGLAGPFTLVDFAGMQSIGVVEYPDGATYIEDYHAVAGYQHRRNQLRATALDETASREVITARRAALERTAIGDDTTPGDPRRRGDRRVD